VLRAGASLNQIPGGLEVTGDSWGGLVIPKLGKSSRGQKGDSFRLPGSPASHVSGLPWQPSTMPEENLLVPNLGTSVP
jgi:hypothetical protein